MLQKGEERWAWLGAYRADARGQDLWHCCLPPSTAGTLGSPQSQNNYAAADMFPGTVPGIRGVRLRVARCSLMAARACRPRPAAGPRQAGSAVSRVGLVHSPPKRLEQTGAALVPGCDRCYSPSAAGHSHLPGNYQAPAICGSVPRRRLQHAQARRSLPDRLRQRLSRCHLDVLGSRSCLELVPRGTTGSPQARHPGYQLTTAVQELSFGS